VRFFKRPSFVKVVSIIVIILIFCPADIAVKRDSIDKERNYVICKISKDEDANYDVVYDSRGRGIKKIRIEDETVNLFTRAKAPRGDVDKDLNTYLIYTDSTKVEGDILVIDGLYKATIIYPIDRGKDSWQKLPKWYLFWFEIS